MAHLPRPIRLTALTALCCGLLIMVTAPAALAHDRLRSSSPAQNAKVSSVERIVLEFTARVRFPTVVLRTAEGTFVPLEAPHAEGDTVTTKIPETVPPGGYVIAWRVVSSDGHPIEGEIPFTVTGAATPSATPARALPPGSPTPAPSVTASPAVTVTAPPAPRAPLASGEDTRGTPGWLWGGLGAVAVIGLTVWFRVRAGKRRAARE
ncbi:hypothetical protein GCM10017673_11230 [Streptosporangium violaceochromogenes]|nr:hypothetical protein GCM10017673_11230 [Streptosporangium violaceochromogenes]